MADITIACISAGRSHNVQRVTEQVGNDVVWYVPIDQRADYLSAGAKLVKGITGVLPMKSIQLNACLDTEFKKSRIVATIDDDIVKVIRKSDRSVVSVRRAILEVGTALTKSEFFLGGPYSGTNTNWSPGVVNSGRIPGAMMVHKRCSLRFDPNNIGAEDLDFCIQHHVMNNGVLLYGELCLANEWSTNEGGYQTYRDSNNLKVTTNLLSQKWACYGASFKLTSDRKNGVSYRVPWKKLVRKFK